MFSSLFQPKILAAIDYIRNVNKQHLNAEDIYEYIFRREASFGNKTDIVYNTDKLVQTTRYSTKKYKS